jgi:hypothetical protein
MSSDAHALVSLSLLGIGLWALLGQGFEVRGLRASHGAQSFGSFWVLSLIEILLFRLTADS